MKKMNPILLMFMFFTVAVSAQTGSTASFEAYLDGELFPVREEQMYRGLLIDKKATMDGKIPARRIITATVHGVGSAAEDKPFAQAVLFEIEFDSLKQTGVPGYFALALQHSSGSYYMVKGESSLEITNVQWESDNKHFVISVVYNCKMRSRSYPADGKDDIQLKGNLTNFRITVPSWLVSKN